MFCHNCGKQIPDGSKFCHYCGAAQAQDESLNASASAQPQQAPYQSAPQLQQTPYQSAPQPQQAPYQSASQPQQAPYQSAAQPQQAPYQSAAQPQQAAYQSTPQPQQAAYQSTPQPQQAAYQSMSQPIAAQKQERVLAGIFGALLCSLAGVVVMFILFKLNFVASLTGIIMLACTAWGYAHFGKALSKKGVFFSVLIVIVMIYVGNQLCWADYIYRHTANYTISWWFFNLNNYIGLGPLRDVENAYYECLTKQYAFAAVGVIFLAFNLSRSNRAAKKK